MSIKRVTHEDQKKLKELFDELNQKHFENILPEIHIRFSGRLKTTGGQYFKKPQRLIQISTRYLSMPDAWDEITDTLGHEMVHYWLDHQGKPCGHTPEFREKLNACGFNRYSRLTPVNTKYIYKCPSCTTTYYRRRRGIWSCGPCSGNRYNPDFRLVLDEEASQLTSAMTTESVSTKKDSKSKKKSIVKRISDALSNM